MITYKETTNCKTDFFNNTGDGVIYQMEQDRTVIGYGKIYNIASKKKIKVEDIDGLVDYTTNNKIEVFIFPQYRGNGFGKELFIKMLETLKPTEKIDFTIPYADNAVRVLHKALDYNYLVLTMGRSYGIERYAIVKKPK